MEQDEECSYGAVWLHRGPLSWQREGGGREEEAAGGGCRRARRTCVRPRAGVPGQGNVVPVGGCLDFLSLATIKGISLSRGVSPCSKCTLRHTRDRSTRDRRRLGRHPKGCFGAASKQHRGHRQAPRSRRQPGPRSRVTRAGRGRAGSERTRWYMGYLHVRARSLRKGRGAPLSRALCRVEQSLVELMPPVHVGSRVTPPRCRSLLASHTSVGVCHTKW